MSQAPSSNPERLLRRIHELGRIGRDASGALTRLAGSDADKAARDLLVAWMTGAGLHVQVDAIGNLFGSWPTVADGQASRPVGGEPIGTDPVETGPIETGPIMTEPIVPKPTMPKPIVPRPIMVGSHIDTVVNAGIYDGAYGVLAGLEAVEALRDAGVVPARPVVVAAFTNEEGVRYTPDMMGSLVHAGMLPLPDALAAVGTDGTTLGDELARIGYAGPLAPGSIRPCAYLELHIEQGPVLEHEELRIGAVENLQGISWQRIVIDGAANHAGTTPMRMRQDAGYAAARIITFLRDYAVGSSTPTVATVGTLRFEPNAINIIPSRATLTVDLRDPDDVRLQAAEAALAAFLARLAADARVRITTERLVRFAPVTFDAGLVTQIEEAASRLGLPSRRMTSGAGHDAQMMAGICPAAMIFVPSEGGISHSPHEHTSDEDLLAGARVLLDVVGRLSRSAV